MSQKIKKSIRPRSSQGFPILRPLLTLLFFGFFCFLIMRSTAAWVANSSYFRIKKITCSAPSKAQELKRFGYLRDQSIFSVDLVGLQKQLTRLFPEAKDIRIMKRFPDEIYVDLKDRPPFAIVVFNDQRFVVDRQGYVTVPNDFFNVMLPLVHGVARPKTVPMGQIIDNQNLKIALNIIDVFQKNSISGSFHIMRINVENTSKIIFFIGEKLEVVADRESIDKQIETLSLILNKARLDWERIRYIDLRFAQPVIKYVDE
ncbi:MAG TPA: cell division protein FtsQ/DivIB [Candidatus Omnitrophota bacterium]|nr:cell division protein FtsQ/DivIB [Candidatus Omnitrophota bacterium]